MARVAIEYSPALLQSGGVGRSVREMSAALLRSPRHEYTLITCGLRRPKLPQDVNARVRNIPIPDRLLTRLWHRQRLPLPAAWLRGMDLFFASNFALPPLPRGIGTAVFVHDLTYLREPAAAVPALVDYLSAVVPVAAARADVIVVNSQSTMADLISAYDIPAHRLRAVQFGIGQRFMRVESHRAADIAARYGLDGEPYILAVGTLQPRKNYPRLIEAVRRLRESGQSVRLAIAGPKGWLIDGMPELAGDAQPDFVRLLGEVPDDDLPALYSAAICFAMPSLYEGFGLPILEAMACGVPVVTSNTSSLPEAAGDAALLVDPRDVDDLTSALKQLLVDKALRESLTSKGLLRVNGLSWDLTARQLQDAFDFALANPRTR